MKSANYLLVSSLLTVLAVLPDSSVMAQESGGTWADKVTFNGDFRLRWEGIYQDDSEDKEQGRFRGRFGFAAEASDDVKLVVRFATGDGNPVSTNLSFGEGFSLKEIGLDRAYVDWKVNDRTHLYAGKMKNPWFVSGGNTLVWDSDLNPEGVAASFKSDVFFGNVGLMVVDEESGGDDTFIYSGQAGVKIGIGESATFTTGIGYFDFTNVVGKVPFYNGRAKGNSVDVDGNYVFDYSIVELFGEYKTKLGDWPFTVFGEWAQNTEVSNEDTAFAVGMKLGSTKQRGDYQFSYAYHDTEADALVGTYTDSDFAGGNTDSNGHYAKAKLALRDNITLGGTFIVAQLEEFAGDERDYNRIMIDIEISF